MSFVLYNTVTNKLIVKRSYLVMVYKGAVLTCDPDGEYRLKPHLEAIGIL